MKIQVKSIPENWENETNGSKPNTVRRLDGGDIIELTNTETGQVSGHVITNITTWKGDIIISFRPEPVDHLQKLVVDGRKYKRAKVTEEEAQQTAPKLKKQKRHAEAKRGPGRRPGLAQLQADKTSMPQLATTESDKEKFLKLLGNQALPKSELMAKLWPGKKYGTQYTKMTALLKQCPEVISAGYGLLGLKDRIIEELEVEPEEEDSDEGSDEPRTPVQSVQAKFTKLNNMEAADLANLFRGWIGKPFTCNDLIDTCVVEESTATGLFEDFDKNSEAFQKSLKNISRHMGRQLVASQCVKDERSALIIAFGGGIVNDRD